MRTPKYNPETYHPNQSYSVKQLSRYDMEVAGVVIYVIAMAVVFAVALVFMLFAEGTVTQARAQSAKAVAPLTKSFVPKGWQVVPTAGIAELVIVHH